MHIYVPTYSTYKRTVQKFVIRNICYVFFYFYFYLLLLFDKLLMLI